MLSKNLQRVMKKIISMIMIIVIMYTIISTLLVSDSYALTQTRNIDVNNIYTIDEGLYPGYASLLQNLKSTHPNWTFTLLYTDLEWSDVLINETIANHARSLVQGKTGEWLCTDPGCDGIPHDASSWFGASQTAVAYYMDPRNFLTEDKIFQFETLSYVPTVHTEAGVEALLSGTFMYNKKISEYYNNVNYGDKTFAQAIIAAAQASGASPYHLASRIKQEIGTNGSPAITGQVGGYEGYFNFYNIGSYASSDPVINGLIWARDHGWNTPEISITEGAKWIANNYISPGQDSLYLQKWDVIEQGGMYSHQYQQNIEAPTTESSSVYKTYKNISNNDLTNTTFNFVIPMYKNMPRTVSRYPSNSSYVSQYAHIIDKLGVGVYIRETPGGTVKGLYFNDYSFLRIELNSAKIGNTVWDKVMLFDGTMGYIATQYVMETNMNDEMSKSAYISSDSNLLNAPRITQNGSTAIRTLYTGQPLTIIEAGKYNFDGFVWYRVRLPDGIIGYIQSNYVTEGEYGEKVTITCDTELALRTTPQGSIIKYINPGIVVTRIEMATTQIGGYYWDKVITNDGIVGYMARERYNPYALWLTPVNGSSQQQIPDEKIRVNETDKSVKAIPQATFSNIQEKYPNATLVSGTENLETGSVVNIDGVEYTIVKLGDVRGAGQVTNIDALMILKYFAGSYTLENAKLLAADVDGNGVVNNVDALAALKAFAGSYIITIK